jgi:rhodanese-related sulfurtransferase
MIIRLTYIVVCLALCGCSIHKLTRLGVYQELPAETYLKYVSDSTVNIVDVRTDAEYQKSHINGAVNVSYFAGHFSENLSKLNLDTTKTTLIYCETQHRSLFVAKKMYRLGFGSIIDLDKGMIKWRKHDFPCVEDTLESN